MKKEDQMHFKTDIEIAQACEKQKITDIAAKIGIDEKYIEQYGSYKAKIDNQLYTELKDRPDGKLILVTAITPTPAGEGKTTTSVGLTDGLRKIGKNAIVALREPSLGPVFGIKGGAAGGGHAQVVPMEDINLHFTGDFHAIGAANNLLAAMLDNHIQQGNALGIDPKQITWKRAVDMNDRQLRHIVDGLGGRMQGVPREDGFEITVASEVMAVLCLSSSISDLKQRLGNITVGYTYEGKPVTARDLKAEGAMAALLKDAVKPNLVQTLEGTPAFIHGGPFANIAHGCNSVIATRMALKLSDYTVTEAGFAADLGAEKFVDIKCRMSGLHPSAIVIRSSSSLPKAISGISDQPLLDRSILKQAGVACFVVGSHVRKTTQQLEQLLQTEGTCAIEVDVQRILDDADGLMMETLDTMSQIVEQGLTPVVYTSRQEIRLEDADQRQRLGQQVSDFLVDIVYRLPFTPSYLVGKGGITSHDILTKGLGIRSARVLGQVIPSVPCVMAPHFPYIIFPGNVGNEDSLREVYLKLK